MSNDFTDVVIAGGGVAGAATAAALSEFGWQVLIIEPGLNQSKRLAGELIHPPGVASLASIGLLSCLEAAGAVPVKGFVAVPDSSGRNQILPYNESSARTGLAIEHGTLTTALLNAVRKLPHVTVWDDARISAIDLSAPHHASVVITRDGNERRLRTQLVIAADGRHSHLRRMAGISHRQQHLSNMTGYVMRNAGLPHPGFGHVFAGGSAPILAYEIASGETRIMFDQPLDSANLSLDALPVTLRSAMERVMKEQSPLRAANYAVTPETIIRGRFVCVGDAGGSCHPLTATGLSACARDAVLLRAALRQSSKEIPEALRRYVRLRETPQRTRMAGAEVLYDVFRAESPDMRLLRNALFRYWQHSSEGRAATMALLSTEEDRFSILLREYIKVCRHALPELIRPSKARRHVMRGLSRALVRLVSVSGK